MFTLQTHDNGNEVCDINRRNQPGTYQGALTQRALSRP